MAVAEPKGSAVASEPHLVSALQLLADKIDGRIAVLRVLRETLDESSRASVERSIAQLQRKRKIVAFEIADAYVSRTTSNVGG
jgi:hypothetical protein